MLPWWKRLLYSFVSVLLGGGVVGAIASCRPALANPETHVDPKSILLSACIVSVASLPGWIVAIPIVVSVKNYSGWRLWAWCVTGVCIGPTLILSLLVYGFLTDSARLLSGGAAFILLATAVSVVTTAMYLFLVSPNQTSSLGKEIEQR